MDPSAREPGAYAFGAFRLDPHRRSLTYDGAHVALRPTLFDVLLYLVEKAGRIVEKDALLEAVWPGRVVEEANLSQAIFWLRAALRERVGEEAETMIGTVRGRGYRFAPEARWEPAASPSRPEPSTPSTPPDAPAPGSSDPWGARRGGLRIVAAWRIAPAAGLLVIAAIAVIFFALAPRRGAAKLGPGNTVVLADLQNRTHDPAFDRTLDAVLRIDIGQSPYVTVMSDKQVRDTLSLMTRPADAALTTVVAQEVCVRANGDAVLGGAVDAIGARYVLTLAATDCSGRPLAGATATVAAREGVVPALERLIGRLRRRLGEPIPSVDRFDVPLAPERTASLDALKAYSEGLWLNDHGRRDEALVLFKHALELDPKLAGAELGLMVIYAGTNQDRLAADAITRAYALRDGLNERQRLGVTALYDQFALRDDDAASRVLAVWTTTYPTDAKAWGNLANLDNTLGRYDEAIAPGRRALALNPRSEQPYAVLARAYLRSGRPDLARGVGDAAIARHVDGDATHAIRLAAAFLQHDGPGAQREVAWSRGRAAERVLLVVQGQIAYAEGRIREGDRLFDRSAELSREQGLPDFARSYRTRLLIDLGFADRARRQLETIDDDDDDDFIFATAEIGDPARAAALLAKQLREHPQGTLLNHDFGPEIRAAAALRQNAGKNVGKNAGNEAVARLQPAIAYQARTFDIPYLLGRAYLAAGDGAGAREAFQRILDHPGWYPESPLYALARLGLARACQMQHDLPAARRAYQAALEAWKDADGDFPPLRAARREAGGIG